LDKKILKKIRLFESEEIIIKKFTLILKSEIKKFNNY